MPTNEHGYSLRSIGNGLVAGYAAGITGVIVGHPLDSIKVLLQTNGGVSSGAQRSSSRVNTPAGGHVITRASSSAAIVAQPGSVSVKANVSTVAAGTSAQSQTASSQGSILGNRSLRALYAGMTGPLLTSGIVQSLNFATYDTARRVLYNHQWQSENPNNAVVQIQPKDYLYHDNLSNVALASFISGSSVSVVTSPMAVVKTKQQLMGWGFRKAISVTYLSGGLRSFYTGFGAHFICESFGRSYYMLAYELSKRQLAQAKANVQSSTDFTNRMTTENLSCPERMLCAASAGMTSWALIFPFDVIKSKLYARTLTNQASPTAFGGISLARQLVREQGIRSLYRGIGVTVARGGPVAAVVLPVYDSVLAWASAHS
ncbi:hypothetical protein ACHAXA_001300 [Cyclostephanos tholiformis]|uniref:Mitochondrial carrier protein n=1 Tax=Cyclostephanos tholiformis TaxID=382380 RepID=A0ABD3RA41_9STRA